MTEFIGDNYGEKNSVCTLCKGVDNTEHVFQCQGSVNNENVTVEDLRNGDKMDNIVELFDRAEKERRNKTLENLFCHFDLMNSIWETVVNK